MRGDKGSLIGEVFRFILKHNNRISSVYIIVLKEEMIIGSDDAPSVLIQARVYPQISSRQMLLLESMQWRQQIKLNKGCFDTTRALQQLITPTATTHSTTCHPHCL